ncbi:RnfABCDGE type electron transport complex subunit E [Candidatus Woesearchaeota archaeon]|nr:RnfABCDGE type electron transport complex subunit E [Candidatus Woesearchaeota archaeon]
MSYFNEFSKGITKINPIFVMALGLCPTLAVTTSLDNAVGMGFATTFVLLSSAVFVSSIRKTVPSNVRIPVFIVIIATFVTIAQLFIRAFSAELNRALGIFLPLIVVNCVILGRAESFSSRNSILRSMLDALGIGAGFSLALLLISSIRELLGTGELYLFGNNLLNLSWLFNPMLAFILAPGALLTMGLLLAFFNWLGNIDFKKQSAHVEEHNGDNAAEKAEGESEEEKKEEKKG